MRKRYFLIVLALVAFLVRPMDVRALEGGAQISVTAASMEYLPDGSLRAEGDVVVRGEGVTVRADVLKYDPGSDTLLLTGNVVMEEEGGGAFTGDVLALDLDDLTGGISRGEIIIVPNGFRVRGENISRTGPEEYSIEKGVFTSCPGDCPDWSFTASRIKVRQEGYLEARHAAFRIVGVPVFYTPYLLYPVKTKRQTGLLFPELSFSDETGYESKWPLFITLGPHADATVSPRTFSRDGFGLELESRYRLHWGGGGTVEAFGITGEEPERWYARVQHSMALLPDHWLRWRWYDAGDPGAPSLFGDTFEERHPGAVYRHATLEGEHGPVGYRVQSTSLLADGALSRADLPGASLDRDRAVLNLGPVGGDLWRLGIEAEEARFDDGGSRSLVIPSLSVWIPGPWKSAGYLHGGTVIATGGEGSTRDEASMASWTQKTALQTSGDWGSHRVGIELTAAASQEAAFGATPLRDARDAVQERRLVDARVTSLLRASRLRWELTAGSWHDSELDLTLNYGMSSLSYAGFFVSASRNRDADFGLLLPSLSVDREVLEGWQASAGYESAGAGIAVSRESTGGVPELLRSNGHVTLGRIQVLAEAIYDIDADSMADETINLKIPGRCWTLGLDRSRSRDRTSWGMQLELGI